MNVIYKISNIIEIYRWSLVGVFYNAYMIYPKICPFFLVLGKCKYILKFTDFGMPKICDTLPKYYTPTYKIIIMT